MLYLLSHPLLLRRIKLVVHLSKPQIFRVLTAHLEELMTNVFYDHRNQVEKAVHYSVSNHPLLTHKETPDCRRTGEDAHLEITSSISPSYGSSILTYGSKLHTNAIQGSIQQLWRSQHEKREVRKQISRTQADNYARSANTL